MNNINFGRLISLALVSTLLFGSIWYITQFFCLTDNSVSGVNCLMIQTPLSALAVIVFLTIGFARSSKQNSGNESLSSPRASRVEAIGWLVGFFPILLIGAAELGDPNNIETVYLISYTRTIGLALLVPCVLVGLYLIRKAQKK